jgi:hypothetical protein
VYVATVCRLGEAPHHPLVRLETEDDTPAAREQLTADALHRAKEIEGAGERVSVQARLEFPGEWDPPMIWRTVYETPLNAPPKTRGLIRG